MNQSLPAREFPWKLPGDILRIWAPQIQAEDCLLEGTWRTKLIMLWTKGLCLVQAEISLSEEKTISFCLFQVGSWDKLRSSLWSTSGHWIFSLMGLYSQNTSLISALWFPWLQQVCSRAALGGLMLDLRIWTLGGVQLCSWLPSFSDCGRISRIYLLFGVWGKNNWYYLGRGERTVLLLLPCWILIILCD